tara:strand:- start:3158 stop:4423 length:1266 start_codon:yes stop_codon:yes gene_type:complete
MNVSASERNILDFEIINSNDKHQTYYFYNPKTNIITVDLAFKNSGYIYDPKDKLGLSYVFLYLLKQLEIGKNPTKLKNLIEENGFYIDTHVDHENFYISFKFLRTYFSDFKKVVSTIIEPEFYNQKILDQTKINIQKNYKSNLGNARFLADIKINEDFYHNTDFSVNPYGNKDSLAKITLSDLNNYSNDRFASNRLNIAISGNISKKELKDFTNFIAKKLKKRSNRAKSINISQIEKIDNHYDIDKEQIILKSMKLLPRKSSKDFYSLYLINYILGGSGLTSKLSNILREENGLTYSTYSYIESSNDFSLWIANISTNKKNYSKAKELFRKTLKSFYGNGINKSELEEAKKYLIGSYDIYFNTNDKISSYLLNTQIQEISINRIKNRNRIISELTLEDVNKTIRKYFNYQDLSFISVGKLK